MDEAYLTSVLDGFIILVGAVVAIHAIIQLLLEFRVKEIDGPHSISNIKVIRPLLFLILGGATVSLRIWYIALR